MIKGKHPVLCYAGLIAMLNGQRFDILVGLTSFDASSPHCLCALRAAHPRRFNCLTPSTVLSVGNAWEMGWISPEEFYWDTCRRGVVAERKYRIDREGEDRLGCRR